LESMIAKFCELIAREQTLMTLNAHDVLVAKIIGKEGFEAIYMTGYGVSASILGKPDLGLLTMTGMIQRTANIV